MSKKLQELANRRKFWRDHPEVFAKEVLGANLTINQRQICRELVKHNKLTIKSANSIGKSYLFAIILLWFFYVNLSDDENVICVFAAPVFAQIKTGLYANFRDFIQTANDNLKKKYGNNVKLFPKEPSEDKNRAEFWYGNKSYVIGISTDNSNAIAGKHADYVLVIFDEAQGIKEDVYSGFEGIMQSGIVKEILLGNPTLPNGCAGRFYESFGDNSAYKKISISSFDTPNFVMPDIKLEDYLCEENAPNYWRKKIDKYCGTNYCNAKRKDEVGIWENEVKNKLPYKALTNPIAVYNLLVKAGFNIEDYDVKTRILGMFPDSTGASTYPVPWIRESKRDWSDDSKHILGDKVLGIDFGRGVGKDKTAFAIVDGNKCTYLKEFDLDTRSQINKVREIYNSIGFDRIQIEKNGEGIVLARLLREEGYEVYDIDVGASAGFGKTYNFELKKKTEEYKKLYALKRDEMWWNLRLRLNPNDTESLEPRFLLPPDPELEKQMRASTYKKNHKQQIIVSNKDELRQRLKRSPDKLDALLIALVEVELDNLSNLNVSNLYTFNLKA